jgi:hypothetical protein
MPTPAERLRVALDNVSIRLTEVTATYKPTYSIDGESYSHESYLTSLVASIASLKAAIQMLENPYQKNTRMRT